ncbi:hypothetical protein BD769DRAFT_221792 [Suillus cothurnatus]|nr:hypothetical protein BD769DRAFT_221792 [Suillus cothurnatus]
MSAWSLLRRITNLVVLIFHAYRFNYAQERYRPARLVKIVGCLSLQRFSCSGRGQTNEVIGPMSTICAGMAFADGNSTYFSNQAISPPDVNLPELSKLSGAVLSRASDALAEVKQLRFFAP